MEPRKIAGWIYLFLLLATVFVLGYFAGASKPVPAEVRVTGITQEMKVPDAQETADLVLSEPTPETPLDLNTASQAQLERLPGIGPELSGRIIAYRQSVGRFVAKEQIMDVEGIGEKRYADLEQLITVEVGHENSGS